MTVSEAVGWTLVHSLWQGTFAAVVLAALRVSVRSPRVRYLAGCLALLATLASFVITMFHFLPEPGSGTWVLIKPELSPWKSPIAAPGTYANYPNFIPWLAPTWLAGVSLFYLRYAAAWVSLYHLRRRGVCQAPKRWQELFSRLASELKISRPVVLLESLLADTPAVLGHFRPVVLVPLGFLTGLPADQVEAILLHELAHIRRSDYLVNVCQRLVEGLLFYHPGVWWISRMIRSERENCCDDTVVGLRGDAHSYAVALTALEQKRLEQERPANTTAMAATGGSLMKRITRLLYPQRPSGIWAPALAAVVLMAGTAMLLPAWHVNPMASQAAEQNSWQKWLNEDVVYIISDQEKATFQGLRTDDERQRFVEQFWERRDPTPGTPENEFREEHYRRIAYANTHWGTNTPGWKTDRGRIYIKFGPPDEIDSHPHGGNYKRPDSEGGATVTTYPFEDWRFTHFESLGNLDIEFVDTAGSGDLRMTLDQNEKYRK